MKKNILLIGSDSGIAKNLIEILLIMETIYSQLQEGISANLNHSNIFR